MLEDEPHAAAAPAPKSAIDHHVPVWGTAHANFAKRRIGHVVAIRHERIRLILSLCSGEVLWLDFRPMTHLILAAILVLMPAPAPSWGESRDEFHARMELISQSIDTAIQVASPPQRRQMAMAVVVTFWGESRFSPLIQGGQHTGDGGRALCLGQLHQEKLSREEWLALAGLDLDSTTRCATVAAKRLKSAWWYCHELNPQFSWPEAFVLYGSGRTCRAEETSYKNIFIDRAAKWATLSAKPM